MYCIRCSRVLFTDFHLFLLAYNYLSHMSKTILAFLTERKTKIVNYDSASVSFNKKIKENKRNLLTKEKKHAMFHS